jgi:hypothetical protein
LERPRIPVETQNQVVQDQQQYLQPTKVGPDIHRREELQYTELKAKERLQWEVNYLKDTYRSGDCVGSWKDIQEQSQLSQAVIREQPSSSTKRENGMSVSAPDLFEDAAPQFQFSSSRAALHPISLTDPTNVCEQGAFAPQQLAKNDTIPVDCTVNSPLGLPETAVSFATVSASGGVENTSSDASYGQAVGKPGEVVRRPIGSAWDDLIWLAQRIRDGAIEASSVKSTGLCRTIEGVERNGLNSCAEQDVRYLLGIISVLCGALMLRYLNELSLLSTHAMPPLLVNVSSRVEVMQND